MKVEVLLTSIEDRTPARVSMVPPKLFFSIYYRDEENSFRRATKTMERSIKNTKVWDSDRDKFISVEVYTEAEFAEAWSRVASTANDGGFHVEQGHLFTHASKPGNSGLEFAHAPGAGDGTISKAEMSALAVLPWRKSGKLFLHGCNTGLTGEKRSWTPAQVFADRQRVRTSGTLGYSYFSTSRERYIKIDDKSEAIYLLPFRRGKNGMFGNGAAIPTRTFDPTK